MTSGFNALRFASIPEIFFGNLRFWVFQIFCSFVLVGYYDVSVWIRIELICMVYHWGFLFYFFFFLLH